MADVYYISKDVELFHNFAKLAREYQETKDEETYELMKDAYWQWMAELGYEPDEVFVLGF